MQTEHFKFNLLELLRAESWSKVLLRVVRINGLNKRGVNCLRSDFRKYMLRMNIDIDLQINELDQPRKQNC